MTLNQRRRPRPAFALLTTPPLRRYSIKCTADSSKTPSKPPSPSSSPVTAPSESTEKLQTPPETSRVRVRLLNNRVVVRAGLSAIRRGEQTLTTPPQPDETSDAIKNLRRDLRSLRRVTEEYGADEDALSVIAKLDAIADAVDVRLTQRVVDIKASAEEVLYTREDLEDELEGVVPPDLEPDIVCVPDTTVESPQFMANVRKKVIDGGNSFKRKASGVGASIEEKVAEFVHEDGSVDVDGLRDLVGGLLDNVNMTWQRLNGKARMVDEADASPATEVQSLTLSVRDTEKEFELQEAIGELENMLISASKERETVLRREDQLGKLMRAKEIRAMDDSVSVLRRTLAVRVLQLEMEKIFVSVAEEIENSESEMMMEQRVLVVEFGELDERLATLQLFIDQEEPLLLDDDTLGELASDILELKTRLGLDSSLYSSATLSWPQVRQFFTASRKRTREGVEFYSRGIRLFAGDVRFAMRLIRRTVTGYSPSPREVRTIRRTGRDLLTLIPFTIVLIAPLTPVGHVLIFSFVQRYWPEFFPSTFSESRQAVMKRHEQYAKSIRADGDNGVEEEKEGLFGWKGVSLFKEENEVEEDEKVHPVALNELAESARDGEKAARKKRISVALEDLHLAD